MKDATYNSYMMNSTTNAVANNATGIIASFSANDFISIDCGFSHNNHSSLSWYTT